MRAVRIVEGRKDFVVESLAPPVRKPGGIVVRMEAAMVASYMGALPLGAWATPPRPFIPGQCAIGIVEQGDDRLAPGQRVYFDAFTGSRSAEDPAADHGFLGCFALGDGARSAMADWPDGSFAEYIRAPAACFTPLPDLGIAPELLCRLGWLGTALHGLRQGDFAPGMALAINGATGIVGAGAVSLALALGAGQIQIFGRRPERLAELVALAPGRVSIGDPGGRQGFDLILDCAAGDDSRTSASLVTRLHRFGKAVFVGGLSNPIALDTAALMRNSNTIAGSYWFTKRDLQELIHCTRSGLVDFSHFRARHFGIDEIAAAIGYATTTAGGLEHTVLTP